ncbi:MAG: MBL fold metallo-hydrolase [Actinobacteria bacterium]|nr:MBL fold metallo-hydrolase [Actinomycetota bacterium]
MTSLQPPVDPRLSWDIPAFGEMSPVVDFDEVVTRVLAPNPSPMTLDGTNTYVVAAGDGGAAIVVDPGPDDDDHLAVIEDVLERRELHVEHLVVTHHHVDHTEAVPAWKALWEAQVHAPTADVAGPKGRVIGDGDRVELDGFGITAVGTPGHTADHLAFRLDHGPVLTGDHVLGRGTSVVAHPDGDLAAYLTSLRRVLDLGPDALYPGHGPALTEDATAVLEYYLAHRAFREQQILALLEESPRTPRALVERIYADVDRQLWGPAEASTRAALVKLAGEDRVAWDGDGEARLT